MWVKPLIALVVLVVLLFTVLSNLNNKSREVNVAIVEYCQKNNGVLVLSNYSVTCSVQMGTPEEQTP